MLTWLEILEIGKNQHFPSKATFLSTLVRVTRWVSFLFYFFCVACCFHGAQNSILSSLFFFSFFFRRQWLVSEPSPPYRFGGFGWDFNGSVYCATKRNVNVPSMHNFSSISNGLRISYFSDTARRKQRKLCHPWRPCNFSSSDFSVATSDFSASVSFLRSSTCLEKITMCEHLTVHLF